MDCSTPGFPVHHQLQDLAQTHIHRVDDAIQPSCPLSSPSPPAFNQCFFFDPYIIVSMMIPIRIPKTLWIFHRCLEHQSSRNLTYHISYTNLSSSCLSASIIGQISTCMFRTETSQSFLTSPSCSHFIFVDYSFKIYLWFIHFLLLISTTTNTKGNHSLPLYFPH